MIGLDGAAGPSNKWFIKNNSAFKCPVDTELDNYQKLGAVIVDAIDGAGAVSCAWLLQDCSLNLP